MKLKKILPGSLFLTTLLFASIGCTTQKVDKELSTYDNAIIICEPIGKDIGPTAPDGATTATHPNEPYGTPQNQTCTKHYKEEQ